MKKLLVKDILELKGKRKITKVTALDYFTARAIELAEIDIIGLDGPPIEIFFKGMSNGERVTLEELTFCLNAVRRGAENTFIMAPIPYGYSFISNEETLRTAIKLIKAGADAVKIEGTKNKIGKIKKLIKEGISCVGHIGLTTEKAKIGGFRSIGKKASEAIELFKDAMLLEETGVIWIEFECVPYKIAAEITKRLKIPTIGVGSGSGCDGQFLHSEDMLGMHDRYYPKHCKKYLNFYKDSIRVFKIFKEDVNKGIFPDKNNSFEIEDSEYDIFIEFLEKY